MKESRKVYCSTLALIYRRFLLKLVKKKISAMLEEKMQKKKRKLKRIQELKSNLCEVHN